ncbi:DUF6732 family protein [Aliiroseovarius lamellibrachiae]|uniref:DUF6732 family protein n=1 Tax=Aliiroseovarius lamellibrachiae TaxID=1924933 RepID=UPI001BE0C220|nr:DUF6732 family protein [Aliiroseovarius lamellibrachiae]MBT2131423.1 hypothetical protein [Aliiroseovarius lamellibrachiae]
MTKSFLMTTAILGLTPLPAMAHVGHIGEVAGHGHWGAIILLGGAAAVSLWAAIKGKKDAEKVEAEEAEAADDETGDEELVGA